MKFQQGLLSVFFVWTFSRFENVDSFKSLPAMRINKTFQNLVQKRSWPYLGPGFALLLIESKNVRRNGHGKKPTFENRDPGNSYV